MLIKKIYNRICDKIWKWNRGKTLRKRLKTVEGYRVPTIISCNCIGGVMYHDMGEKFLSPTINLYMSCCDFVKFCEKLEYYLSLDLMPYNGEIKREYPLCTLGDLIIYMVHYQSFEEARDKWNSRIKRVQQDNIRIVATDRDGCSTSLKRRFDRLPYKKVMFTHLPDEECINSFYIRGFEDSESVGNIIEHEGKITGKRYFDQFDWVTFLMKL